MCAIDVFIYTDQDPHAEKNYAMIKVAPQLQDQSPFDQFMCDLAFDVLAATIFEDIPLLADLELTENLIQVSCGGEE
jgi:hypothetical protein